MAHGHGPVLPGPTGQREAGAARPSSTSRKIVNIVRSDSHQVFKWVCPIQLLTPGCPWGPYTLAPDRLVLAP